MIKIEKKEDCCGCKACGDACNQQAITFKADIEGFWYPYIDITKCNNCGLCERVCPIINISSLKKNDIDQAECYAAINNNQEIRFDSTSGGLFSALAENMYSKGGYVGGAIFTENWSVKHFISAQKTDLDKIRSSKYLQSDTENLFTRTRELLKKGEKVLICGTPCQMAALRAFLRKPYPNLIIVDFICRGINSPKIFRKYLDYLEKEYNSKIIYFKAKNKELGWRQLTNKIVFENGKVLYDHKSISTFMKGYLKTNAFCRPSCYNCKFKGLPRMADITLADFWGSESIIDKKLDGDMGTSLVMINSLHGRNYFNQIKDKIQYQSVPFSSIFAGNKALTLSLPQPQLNREELYKAFDSLPYIEVFNQYIEKCETGYTLKTKLKKIARFWLTLIQSSGISIQTLCKNIYYNFFSKKVKGKISRGQYIILKKSCILNLKKDARIILEGPLIIGAKGFFKQSTLETRLYIGENGKLIVKGQFIFSNNSDIEIFKDGILEIEGNGYANTGATIICGNHITIGRYSIMGRDVRIRDDNGNHQLGINGFKNSNPVNIGQHVWLCSDSSILPGCNIGPGSVIAANSIVTKDIPPFVLAAGNPAKVIKNVTWKGEVYG